MHLCGEKKMDAQPDPDVNNENDDENKPNSQGIITDILIAPMQFVKNLIPGSKKSEDSEEDGDSEMVSWQACPLAGVFFCFLFPYFVLNF